MSRVNPHQSDAWKHPAFFIYFAFIALGVGVLMWSVHHWHQLHAGALQGQSFCNLGDYWNCDRVALSPYAAFMGVPIGVFGAAWFLLLGLFALCQDISRKVIYAGYAIAWALCVFLAIVLITHLKTGCLICILGYIAWFGAGVSFFFYPAFRPFGIQSSLFMVLVAWTLLGMAAFGMSQSYQLEYSQEEVQRFRESIRRAPAERIQLQESVERGRPEAPMQIVEFSDFGCPACAHASRDLIPHLLSEPDVRLSYVLLPRDGECNPRVPEHIQTGICELSRAALCAREQGKFWEFRRTVFDHLLDQGRNIRLEEAIRRSRVNAQELQDCLDSGRAHEVLDQMIQTATDSDIRATPTFFVNGRRIPGNIPLPLFRIVLDELRALEN